MRKDVKAALDAMIDKVLAYTPEPKRAKPKKRRGKKTRNGKKS